MELAEAYVEVRSDMQSFYRDIDRARGPITQRLATMGAAAGTAFSAAATAGITAGLALLAGGGALAVIGVKLASDADEIQSKFEAVFKELTPQAEAFAATFAGEVGRSVIDTKAQLSGLQDLFKPLGFANKDAMELSKTVTKLGVDLASFNNISDDEAIQRLTAGLLGESEPLKKFGIVMGEATVKAELLAMGIKKVDEATNVQKAMARMNIIMRSTTDAQGDAIRTAGSFANVLKGLYGSTKDLGVEFGRLFLPAAREIALKLRELVGWMRSNAAIFTTWGNLIGESTRNILGHVTKLATTMAATFGEGLNARIKAFTGGGASTFGEFVTQMLQGLAIFTQDWRKTWELAKNIVTAAAVQIAINYMTQLQFLKSVAFGVFEGVKQVGMDAFEGIRLSLEVFGIDFAAVFQGLKSVIDKLVEHALNRFRQLSSIVPQFASTVDAVLKSMNLGGGKNDVMVSFQNAQKKARGFFGDIQKDAEEKLQAVGDSFGEGFSRGFDKGQANDDPITRALNGLKGRRDELAGARNSTIADLVGMWDMKNNRDAPVRAPVPPGADEVKGSFAPLARLFKGVVGIGGDGAMGNSGLAALKAGDVLKAAAPMFGKVAAAAAAAAPLAGPAAELMKKAVAKPGIVQPAKPVRDVTFSGLSDFAKNIQQNLTGKQNDPQNKIAAGVNVVAEVVSRIEQFMANGSGDLIRQIISLGQSTR